MEMLCGNYCFARQSIFQALNRGREHALMKFRGERYRATRDQESLPSGRSVREGGRENSYSRNYTEAAYTYSKVMSVAHS